MIPLELKIAEINRIEKHGLSVFEFDSINWWPLIRIYLFQNHQDQKQNSVNQQSLIYPKRVLWEIRVWLQQKKQFQKVKSTFDNKRKQVDTIFLTSDNNYKKDAKDKYINRYLDPLYLETTGTKTILVRSKKKEENYVVKDLLAVEYFELQLKLKEQITIIFRTLFFGGDKASYSSKHKIAIDKIIQHIQTFKFFNDFNFTKLPKWFNQVIETRNVAQLLFNKIKPKTFIQYCYYFPTQFGYTLAANSLNINSVDYQHGIQNKFHYGYGSWLNVPQTGYQLLPKEFWVFSEREKTNLLASFSQTPHVVKVVGNKWIDYWQDNKTNQASISWLLDIKKSGNVVLLYTVSNYLIEKEHFFWQYLAQNKSNKIFVLFRLHPGYLYLKEALISRLNEIDFKNFNIEDATAIELYDLLEVCDTHITQNSTVAEEALHFNKKTIIIDPKWGLYFESYIANGDMFLANNDSDLEKYINTNLKQIHD